MKKVFVLSVFILLIIGVSFGVSSCGSSSTGNLTIQGSGSAS